MNKFISSKLLYCLAMIVAILCSFESQSTNNKELSRIESLFRVPTLQGINQVTWRFNPDDSVAVSNELTTLRKMHDELKETVGRALCEKESENYQRALSIFSEYFSTIQMEYTEHREGILIFLTHQLSRIRECATGAMNHDEIEILHLVESNVTLLLHMYQAWQTVRDTVFTNVINPDEITKAFEFAKIGTMRPRQFQP